MNRRAASANLCQNRSCGYTLIEMLIVIAIIAIISVVIGAATELSLRGGADMRLRMETQSEAAGLMNALTREVAAAQWIKRIPLSAQAPNSSETLALALRLDFDDETIQPAAADSGRWVVYVFSSGCIRRILLAPGEQPDPLLLAAAFRASVPAEASGPGAGRDSLPAAAASSDDIERAARLLRRSQTIARNIQKFCVRRDGEIVEALCEAKTEVVGKPIRLRTQCAFRALRLEKCE